MIQSVLSSPEIRKEQPPFIFKTDRKPVAHNAEILKKYDYSLDAIIKDNSNTIISPGSEFRSTFELGPLLHSHPHWSDYKEMMENGVDYKFREISEDQHRKDLDSAIKSGNYKSTQSK